MDKVFVTTSGVIGILLTYWFFFMKKEQKVEASGIITVVVDGGYSPNVIAIKRDVKTTLVFTRKDPSPCLEEILIPDFKIKRPLPLNKSVSVVLEPHISGEYQMRQTY